MRLKGRVENFGPVLDQLTSVDGLWNKRRAAEVLLADEAPDLVQDLLTKKVDARGSQANMSVIASRWAG